MQDAFYLLAHLTELNTISINCNEGMNCSAQRVDSADQLTFVTILMHLESSSVHVRACFSYACSHVQSPKKLLCLS